MAPINGWLRSGLVVLGLTLLFVGCAKEAKPENYREKYARLCKEYSAMSEEEQLKAVSKHWQYVDFIQNPSPKVQKAAVEGNADAIQYIKHPTKEVQRIVIDKLITGDGFTILIAKYINRFDEDVQAEAVAKAPEIIRHIPYPAPNVQLSAIRKNPWVAKSINNLTPQAKKEAISLEPKLKEFLK